MLALAGLSSACAELQAAKQANETPAVKLGSGVTVGVPAGADPGAIVMVGFDGSTSDVGERQDLLKDLVQVVIPAAVARQATLVVDIVGARGFNGGSAAAVMDFKAALSGDTLTPQEAETNAAQSLVSAVRARIAGAPAQGSDIIGFLRRAQQTHAEFPHARFLVVYLGDGGQNSPGCDIALMPIIEPYSLPAVVRSCENGMALDLHGIEAWLLGIGLAVGSSGMPESEALAAQRFLVYLARTAGADVSQVAVAPIPGAGS